MLPEELKNLKKTFEGKTVKVEPVRPELTRFANRTGVVITVNANGRAMVQFDGPNPGWYDIDPSFLEIIEPAEASATE
jgi:hypothetical protein